MSTTIFNAPEYDPQRDRRRRQRLIAILVFVAVIAAVAFLYRNWPEERVVSKFFTALEQKDYETAYGIWIADKNWKQHPQKYPRYPFNEFYLDWGPGGEYGIVKSHKIDASGRPRKGGSGIVVVVTVNERKEPARIWVEKSDKSLTFSPY